MFTQQDKTAINELRCLCADVVQTPKSGHPGAPIGMSPMAYVLFTKFMRFSSKNPEWMARDRFVLSSGHASALLYSMLHLCGYDYSIEDLKKFRTLHSKTPGHPERVEYSNGHKNPGIEVTTGPLGQGLANAVGMAIAMDAMKPYDSENMVVDKEARVYAICGDGCLQEGVASEACSLAGTKKLKNLIVLYDDNSITIDGRTSLSFAESVKGRFEAYGWNVLEVKDGNNDIQAIYDAINAAKQSDKPTLIKVTTIIGYGAEKQDSHSVHGSPLGPEGCQYLKKAYGLPENESFRISEETRNIFKQVIEKNEQSYQAWQHKFEQCAYKQEILDRFSFIQNMSVKSLIEKITPAVQKFNEENKSKATRQSSQAAIQLLHDTVLAKYMIIGSADLAPSCLTTIKNLNPAQYIYFGVREMGMCAISNGISAYGGFVPFDATFLVFFNYCMGAIRVGAISKLQTIHVFTHDSIFLGEDGGTHQPIETLAQIRAMIGVYDWRPCDCQETLGAYIGAAGRKSQHVMALTRQNVNLLNSSLEKTAEHGAYVIYENEAAKFTLLSSGSEVETCIN
ncbi:Transketolase [Hexamita inflata]|uniref:Transketolase n=1 Tax=Hexamita inflata TaxID=28002 RepID=A0AA86U523_9EUKA|nr:Transketolase [Hexamita inflata]